MTNEIAAHFYAGLEAMMEEAFQEAELHFQYVLSLKPDNVPSLVNLGALALKRDSAQEAVNYFTQALVFNPTHGDARRNIAATFLHYDRFENALTHYKELEKYADLQMEDWYNMGVAHMSLGHFVEAINCYEQVLTIQPTHTAALNNLAAIYIRQGQRDRAIPLLKLALDYQPSDDSSRFMLNVLEKNPAQPRESQEYVKNLFNNYAVNFDQHVIATLKYSLPEKSAEILKNYFSGRFSRVLDLGCGTGLSGVTLCAISDHMTGVDLSTKMLDQARLKNCYDVLIEEEVITFLNNTHDTYDLIQALDVLPYFGDLNGFFASVSARLSSEGFLLLSVEMSEDKIWKIQDSMRFCHHPDYVLTLADTHGLTLHHQEILTARQENDQALEVLLILFQAGMTAVSASLRFGQNDDLL